MSKEKRYITEESHKYLVIRDTREKEGSGWMWEPSHHTKGTVVQTLQTGDYTIDGFQEFLCVERKHSVSEIAGNIIDERFERELQRMCQFKYKFIICEFSLSDVEVYPDRERMSDKIKNRIKIKGSYIMRMLSEYELKYGVHIVFAGNSHNAKWYASSIFKRLMEGVAPYNC